MASNQRNNYRQINSAYHHSHTVPLPLPSATMLLFAMAVAILLLQPSSSTAFISIYPSMMESSSFVHHSSWAQPHHHRGGTIIILSSTWDDFAYYDDNLDDDDAPLIDSLAGGDAMNFVPADENDDPSVKAAAGMALQPPDVDYDGPVIDVPQGKGK